MCASARSEGGRGEASGGSERGRERWTGEGGEKGVEVKVEFDVTSEGGWGV